MKFKSYLNLNALNNIKEPLRINDILLFRFSKKYFYKNNREFELNELKRNTNDIYLSEKSSLVNSKSNSNSNKQFFLNLTAKENNQNLILNRNYFCFSTKDTSDKTSNNNNNNNNNNKKDNKKITISASKNTTSSADPLSREELEKTKNQKLANKLDTIFKNEFDDKVKNQKENEFIQNKIRPFNNFYSYLRYPIYAIMIPMPWMNPFSTTYSITLLASNYYMIFLTLIESSFFFGAGLTYYLLNFEGYKVRNNLVSIRDKRNFKRMSVAFLHFSLIMLSAVLANSYSNQYSLLLLLLGNVYLYAKSSYHIYLKLFPKDVFDQRMLMIFINCGLCIGLLLIISWKRYLHSMIA